MSQSINKKLRYFCKKCGVPKATKIVILFPEDENGKRDTGIESEVIKTFESVISSEGKSEKREFRGRQLECNHFISFYTPGFISADNDNISDVEIHLLREEILSSIIGLQAKELEAKILFHCEQYQTLLRISSKQLKQAKYAIQMLDELRAKYSEQLKDDKVRQDFDMKFAHFTNQQYAAGKVIERERTRAEKESDKQKKALDDVKALLLGKGFDPKELFKK